MTVDWEPIRAALAAGLIVERQCDAASEPPAATVDEGMDYMHNAGQNCSAGTAVDEEGWRLRMEPAPTVS